MQRELEKTVHPLPRKYKNKNNLLISHLASDVFVNQMVLAFVVKDNMNLLCARAADIRT